MPNSTTRPKGRKVAAFQKPHKDFPLFPHATGRWAKKIRGSFHYFGKCADDPKGQAALELWLERKDDLLAGRKPRNKTDGITLLDLCERFLATKDARVKSGELAPTSFQRYQAACQRLVDEVGKRRIVADLRADDFERLRASMAKRWGPVGLGNEITLIRMVFKYAYDVELIDKPIRFGPDFARPNKKTLRKERAKKGQRLFEPAQIHAMLDGAEIDGEQVEGASVQLRAMILLGVNCGFGNSDCGNLPIDAIDLKAGWLDFPRPKTHIDRRCKLWPQTVAAIKAVLACRPEPRDGAEGLLFVTKYGGSWAKDTADSPISNEARKLLDRLGIYRPGLTFYALRHTFETIAGETKDQVAVNAIMGHVDDSMAAVYRERISDERLEAVADHVLHWLFGEGRTNG